MADSGPLSSFLGRGRRRVGSYSFRRLDPVNEWQLQRLLTEMWAADGIELDGELHFLVAWEVMTPSWRINDASKYWVEPSIDFLVADSSGRLGALELKMSVPGSKPAWRVLCQVTHRSVLLRRTFGGERLNRAYADAHSGRHGRPTGTSRKELSEGHQAFFGLDRRASFRPDGMKRFVAALTFGPRFEQVLSEFNALSADELEETLEQRGLLQDSRANREPRRLVTVEPAADELKPPIAAVAVEVS